MRPSRTWGCYVRRWRLWGGDAMRWQIMLELAGSDGTPQRHEVSSGERIPTGHTAATLGLSLEEGKAVLAAVQRHLVTAQVDEHCRSRRRCDRCGAQRPLKDLRPRRLTSLFGVVEVRAPRFGPCRCGVACRRSLAPVAEVMPDRCTPEYERVIAAANDAGKSAGIFCGSPDRVPAAIADGFRMIAIGSDGGYMMQAARQTLEAARAASG